MSKARGFFVLLAFMLAPLGARGAIDLPVPKIETLPNGLTLAWFVGEQLPLVDMALLVKSGYRDDPKGKSGVAELLSSCLDRGAGGMTAPQLAEAVERLGASKVISADEDAFTLGMHGLSPDAPKLLALLARVALHPDFPAAEVERERARLLDRWNHIGDYGETLAGLTYHRAVASGTEYARGSFLSAAEFKRVGRADVVEFHRRHFTPRNAVLMIVGRVKPDEFRPRVLEAFGAWRGDAPAGRREKFRNPGLAVKKGQVLLVERAGLTQAQVRIGLPAPLVKAPEHYALAVANAMLGEYFNSRLNSVLRDQLGLTYGIASGFSYSQNFATLTITSATRNPEAGALIKRTIAILAEMKRGAIPDMEVTLAKEYLVGGFPLSVATLGSVAARWLAGYMYELGPGYLNEYIPKITAVTPVQVKAAVAKDFDLDRLTIVVAGDGKEVAKSLAAAKLPFKRVSVKDLK
jgi:zinc protease